MKDQVHTEQRISTSAGIAQFCIPLYMIRKINLSEKLSLFNDHWNPRILAELNGQHVKLAKFQGAFEWHSHPEEDEMFLVLKGSFVMQLRDGDIELKEGECMVIPKGVEHCPSAEEEVCVMLFEPASTLNTGDHTSDRTVADPAWI